MKLLSAALLLAPMIAFAADPFDGTWRAKIQNAQFGTKPDRWEVANGMYKCFTCDPPFSVKADGQDQPRTGSPYSDTIIVRIVDPNTVEVKSKKDGKFVSSRKFTVAANGKTATSEGMQQPVGSDKPVTGTFKYRRVAEGPAGSHAMSGSWLPEKAENFSDNALAITYKTTADGLSMTTPTGESFTAKFDGKDYPYKGNPGITSVSLKRIDANTIEETDKRDGKAINTTRMTVSADGHTMTVVAHDFRRNDTATFTAEKQ
jgi:hypothetical protein